MPRKIFPKLAILKLGSLNPRVQGVVESAASFVAHVDGRARTNYAERGAQCSLQLRVLRFGLLQDGDVGVGIFP